MPNYSINKNFILGRNAESKQSQINPNADLLFTLESYQLFDKLVNECIEFSKKIACIGIINLNDGQINLSAVSPTREGWDNLGDSYIGEVIQHGDPDAIQCLATTLKSYYENVAEFNGNEQPFITGHLQLLGKTIKEDVTLDKASNYAGFSIAVSRIGDNFTVEVVGNSGSINRTIPYLLNQKNIKEGELIPLSMIAEILADLDVISPFMPKPDALKLKDYMEKIVISTDELSERLQFGKDLMKSVDLTLLRTLVDRPELIFTNFERKAIYENNIYSSLRTGAQVVRTVNALSPSLIPSMALSAITFDTDHRRIINRLRQPNVRDLLSAIGTIPSIWGVTTPLLKPLLLISILMQSTIKTPPGESSAETYAGFFSQLWSIFSVELFSSYETELTNQNKMGPESSLYHFIKSPYMSRLLAGMIYVCSGKYIETASVAGELIFGGCVSKEWEIDATRQKIKNVDLLLSPHSAVEFTNNISSSSHQGIRELFYACQLSL